MVKDNKSVVGTNFKNDIKSLQNLKADIANHTTNRITFKEIYETFLDGLRVILFQIPVAPPGVPIAWKGHYYGRDASELQPLNIEEFERIRSQNKSFDWSIQICENATIEDLSKEAITRARELYVMKNSKLADEIKTWDDMTFLNKSKICIKNKITNTAIILLGKSESEHFLSPAVSQITWILKDKDNIEKKKQFISSLEKSLEVKKETLRQQTGQYVEIVKMLKYEDIEKAKKIWCKNNRIRCSIC